ncbi:myosin light chain kinase 3 [Carlito syrichta]|uniref:Myosin light chain kinase 3 n=1 Tax=Carlito syrichta TaxID=1868482 RepID=A0A1U7TJP2_CARSF|nr:myosin light chain kinase 3 [Carlito syrichta]
MSGASEECLGPQELPMLNKVCLTTMDKKLSMLNEKVDKLLHFQEDVTEKLHCVCQGMSHLEQGLHRLEASRVLGPAGPNGAPPGDTQVGWPEVLELVRATQQEATQHGTRLEALFRMMVAVDRAITVVGSTLQNSKGLDFTMQGSIPWRRGSLADGTEENRERAEERGAKRKHVLSTRGVQTDIWESWEESQKVDLPEGTVERLPPISASGTGADFLTQAGASPGQRERVPGPGQVSPDHLLLLTETEAKVTEPSSENPGTGLELCVAPSKGSNVPTSQEAAPNTEQGTSPSRPDLGLSEEGMRLTSGPSPQLPGPPGLPAQARTACGGGETLRRVSIHMLDMDAPGELLVTTGGSLGSTCPTEALAAAHPGVQDLPGPRCCLQGPGPGWGEQTPEGARAFSPLQKSSHRTAKAEEKPGPGAEPGVGPRVARQDGGAGAAEALGLAQDRGLGAGHPEPKKDCTAGDLGGAEAGARTPPGAEAGSIVLDDSPAPPAPFEHRVVSVKETSVSASYTVCQHDVLGGGRFGQVHRCTEKSTGLPLAAKIIKVKSAKDREDVKNEISIMNQLGHVNLIQLYDAFESKNSFTLVMEYVHGGELFDRITDEKYHLTELDVVLFTKQICEGVRYLHQHYILHLDLKPENILCVNQTGHQIKIIDFGLARRYKPREKLKVNFGTPEFLAPEVVNYEFVSFPTDMWSVGVITYMLLSGLSPFLGETDAETMNFIVNCSWDFDADTFEGLSEEAKDFLSRLLVKEKSCRMSATQCLKHEWLNNLPAKASRSKVCLKSQILLQKYMAQRKWKKHFYVVTAANRLRKFPTCP